MRDANNRLLGEVAWERSAHGGNGYITKVVASASGRRAAVQGDVCPPLIRDVDALEWRPMVVPGRCPPDLIDFDGAVPGGYDIDFAAGSETIVYVTIKDRVLRYDGLRLTETAIAGLPVGANQGDARTFAGKGQADPTDPDTYYVFMGPNGLRATFDGGATATDPAWCPRPSHPHPDSDDHEALQERYGLVGVDAASPLVDGRHRRVAFAPCGEGVWLSEDGGGSGRRISPPEIEAVSCLLWRDGALHVCATDKDNPGSTPDENLWTWTAAEGWTRRGTDGQAFRFLVADPRGAGAFWGVQPSNEFSHTRDGAVWVHWTGGAVGTPGETGMLGQCKVRARPVVARIYRDGGGGSAPGLPVVIGPWLYFPLGYGVLRSPVAEFPTAGADYTDRHPSPRWPTWEEDTAGIEELVGMSVLFSGERLLCLSQDKPVCRWPDRATGHRASVSFYPGHLSNGIGASHGVDPDYVVVGANKGGPFYGYSLDGGRRLTRFSHQPQLGDLYRNGGYVVAGLPGVASVWPTTNGDAPQYTDDLGATAWKRLRFFLEDGTEIQPASREHHGFHGQSYVANHHIACHDLGDPGTHYAVNIGSAAAGGNWELDPSGWAGLYRSLPGEFPIFRRVLAGQLTPWNNRSYHDAKLLADGQGHLFFMTNPVPSGDEPGNRSVVIDLETMTRRVVASPYNIKACAFGAPFPGDGRPALWLVGWHAGVFGLWLKRDLDFGAANPPLGPFDAVPPGAGAIGYLDARKDAFGVLAGAVSGQGHAIGRYRTRLGA